MFKYIAEQVNGKVYVTEIYNGYEGKVFTFDGRMQANIWAIDNGKTLNWI